MTVRQASETQNLVVLVADDHALFRQGFAFLLKDDLQFGQVHQAGDLETALDLAASLDRLDLMALDLNMPGMSGVEGFAAAREAFPGTRLVAVSASERPEDVTGVLGAGADGFIPKQLSPEATVEALRAVLRGERFVPPGYTPGLPRAQPAGTDGPSTTLTPRQTEVLRHLMQGRSAKEIARALSLGEGTVRIHLAGAYRTLGVRNRVEAVLKAKTLPGFGG